MMGKLSAFIAGLMLCSVLDFLIDREWAWAAWCGFLFILNAMLALAAPRRPA